MDFQAAIFDLDGTLLDSFYVWEKVDEIFLNRRGISVPEDYSEKIAALSPRECANYTIRRFGLEEKPEDLIREWYSIAADEYAHHVRLFPGAGDYLRRLKERGIKLAVASSLAEELSRPCLIHNGIFDLFDVICTTDHVTRGKEYPDLYFFTAEKLGISPEHCIVFEDVFLAAKSAKNAGMTVFGVCCGSEKEDQKMKEIADGCLSSFGNAPLPEM